MASAKRSRVSKLYAVPTQASHPLCRGPAHERVNLADTAAATGLTRTHLDRKSTRLNSSHSQISYAVFCLKKKKKKQRAPVFSDTRRSESRRYELLHLQHTFQTST